MSLGFFINLCDNIDGDEMKKLMIACDLDGTLLDGNSELTTETIAYLKNLTTLGHKVVIATGRPFRGCYHYYQTLDLDTPIITDNGGSIENPRNPHFQKMTLKIPKRIIDKLFNYAESFTRTAFYSVDNGLYVYKPSDRLNWLYHETEDTFFVEGPFTNPDHPEPSGLMYIIDVAYKKAFESFIMNECDGLLLFRDWGSDQKNAIFEIYQKRTSKGEALEFVRQYYNFEPDQVIAFGDGLNDLDMLQIVNHGVAMKNGVDEVKAVAKAITFKPNTENGVIDYLKQYIQED